MPPIWVFEMKCSVCNFAAVVPVFNPEPGLIELCKSLCGEYVRVIVVDDGSVEGVDAFVQLRSLQRNLVLVTHKVNQGKGRAMKSALEWLSGNAPEVEGAVFVDGDGQHRPKDVAAVVDKSLETGNVTLGTRDFSKANIPFRSRFGNVITSFLVRLMFRISIYDTQTGLRAIPRRLFSEMIALPGERYEYEMRLFGLLRLLGERMEQVPIETIYLENNRASHFRPICDSIKIYRGLFGSAFLKFCTSSLASFLLDNAVFTMMIYAVQALGLLRRYDILLSLVVARLISSAFNYFCNQKVVFCSRSSVSSSVMRYAILAIGTVISSYVLTAIFSAVFNALGATITVVKIGVETVLFFLSYQAQKRWVFKR